MSTFIAGVQYNDFRGSVAADISDEISLIDHLVSLKKASQGERVVAFRIGSSGIRSVPVTEVSLVAYLTNSPNFEPAPSELRAVEIRVAPGQALAFFKRFDLVAQRDNVDLRETKVDSPHYE